MVLTQEKIASRTQLFKEVFSRVANPRKQDRRKLNQKTKGGLG